MEREWSHEDRITPGWRYTSRLHSLGNPESVDLTGNRAGGNRGPLAGDCSLPGIRPRLERRLNFGEKRR
jgi:hypothetical protein